VNWRWIAVGLLAAASRWAAAGPITLPIYIEDNHAGSFYWLAEQVDPDEELTLVHFDAHSDASAVFDSDKVREHVRRVGSLEERRELLRRWRETGLIQCFNWIEPLMPAPISRVIWVRGPTITKARADAQQKEAVEFFDGTLEASPRQAGSFRNRCRVVGFDQLRPALKGEPPMVITIDLDYFADVPVNRRATEFERVWKFVTESRNLRAVTIAVSRPYLKNEQQADDLLRLALTAALSLPTATIQFEPFAKVANDRSELAQELRKRHQAIPEFDLTKASEGVRAILLANHNRIAVGTNTTAWEKLLADWDRQAPQPRLMIKDRAPSTDSVWRLPADEQAQIELERPSGDAPVQRMEWIALTPEYDRCNLTAKSADQIGFAQGAPPRPRWKEVPLPGKGFTFPLADASAGALRVKARVEVDGRIRETPPIEIRRFAGSGFRAAITEQFRLPYLFGSGELETGSDTGPDTGFGADCANFVVYAMRRQGRAVPWSNPKQLRRYLEIAGENVRAGEPRITERDLENGLIVHFGNHVAAVMEDRPPRGILDDGDLVAHHLEGKPETLSLGRLLAKRPRQTFDLLRVSNASGSADLLIGGDVMLGRNVGIEIENGTDPFAGMHPVLERTDATLVNLECVLSDQGTASPQKRYALRAPLSALEILTSARIGTVSLANNHAEDFGRGALLDSIARLNARNVNVVGAGETPEQAYAAHLINTRSGAKIAVIALDDVVEDPNGIATANDKARIATAIAEAKASAPFVVAFVHWGDENTSRVTERQRELARWLIDNGVDAVAGAHPHCIQPADSYHGRPIFYSLGNLVFDGAPGLPSWNHGQLLELHLADNGKAPALFRLLPVELDARGFPQMVEPKPRNGGLQTAERNQTAVWTAPLLDYCCGAEKNFATAGAALSRNRVQGDSKNR
jgi:hypothetical protein